MVQLRDYQQRLAQKIVDTPNLLVVAPMGSGKTLATLTAISCLTQLGDERVAKNILIIAPKRVALTVWVQESIKYNLGLNIRFCKTALDIKLFLCEQASHTVCVTSVTRIDEVPHGCWDMVVVDESTLFKNKSSNRSKEARRICNKVGRRILLTGTPIHNGYEGLWHQLFLVDGGRSLGKTLTSFRSMYMREKFRLNGVVTVYEMNPDRVQHLLESIRDSLYVVKDNAELPTCFYEPVLLELPKRRMVEYEKMEEDSILQFEAETNKSIAEVKTLKAFAASSLGMKLRQLASGTVYTDEQKSEYVVTHAVKIEAIKELLEVHEGGILVAYQFRSELSELKKSFKEGRMLETSEDIAEWNDGKIRLAFVHPQSHGHGLNLQFGGHVLVWYSLTYDGELYSQLNKRIDRSGQVEPVFIAHLLMRGTIDERLYRILERKEGEAAKFIESLSTNTSNS